MNRNFFSRKGFYQRLVVLWVLLLLWTFHPGSLIACSACYGQSDSAMAKGMNWGILSLLAVVITVLGGIAGFFVFVARRSTGTGTMATASHSNSSLPITTEI